MPRLDFIATNRRPDLFRQDPSFRYRCENLALGLQERGWKTRLLHANNLTVREGGEIVVFHRPVLTPRLAWMTWRLRRRGVRLLADFDDLVFDPAFTGVSPAVLNGILSAHKIRRRFAAASRALRLFDRITVSTEPLVEHVQALAPGVPVTVIPNAVHHSWLQDELPHPETDHPKILTYFPGTFSHDRDFGQIVPALETVLARHPELQLHITGRLHCALPIAPGQCVRNDRVEFGEYGRLVARGWVNLAPLEPTPFNRCKSALKVLEAGFHGIPTVCSPGPDAERFREAGAVFAEDVDTWVEAVERLLEPQEYRARTWRLRDRVLALADPAAMADAFVRMLQG